MMMWSKVTGATLAYALLMPLVVLAIIIWVPSDPSAHAIAVVFATISALLLSVFPRDLELRSEHWPHWLGGALVALLLAAVMTLTTWLPVSLPLLVLVCAWLLRLQYIRQYHRQRERREQVELLRRCLLIALWTHVSVLTALWSPYQIL